MHFGDSYSLRFQILRDFRNIFVFNYNLTYVPSENEAEDDPFEECEGDSSDSKIIRPVKKDRVAMFSRDCDTEEDNDSCWSEMFKNHSEVITFHLSVTL